MRIKPVLVTLSTTALIIASCSSGGSTPTTTPSATSSPSSSQVPETPPDQPPTSYSEYRQQTTACGGSRPDEVVEMQFAAPTDADIAEAVVAVVTTSCGPIEITLNPSLAPETVNSFVFLAEQGYFNGSVSHRVMPGFMMQAGDPTATGRGGPGYRLPDELPVEDFLYQRGIVAMANAGPGTSGSQFFIMFGDATWLPPKYSVFGYVTGGFETMNTIENLPLGLNPNGSDQTPSVPLQTLYIESVQISR